MAVPDYQSLMLPLMKFVADDKEHTLKEARDVLAKNLDISDSDRRELLPSGRQRRFDNRIAWAVVYLKKAGLLVNTSRGVFRITEKGHEILKSNPSKINVKFLMEYGDPAFREFHKPSRPLNEHEECEETIRTPREVMEAGYQELRQELSQELLDHIKSCSPRFFEQLVVDLLVAMGYGGSLKDAGEAVGQSGDEGIDGIIKEDKLGLDAIYIQAKWWDKPVGARMAWISRVMQIKYIFALIGKAWSEQYVILKAATRHFRTGFKKYCWEIGL